MEYNNAVKTKVKQELQMSYFTALSQTLQLDLRGQLRTRGHFAARKEDRKQTKGGRRGIIPCY